jgi:hypothetical protein
MKLPTRLRRFHLLAAGFVLAVSSVDAQVVWDGSESGSWADGNNWVGGSAPVNGNSLTFSGTSNQENTNDVTTPAAITNIGTLTLSNAGWDIDLGGTVSVTTLNADGSSKLTGNVTFKDGSPRTITLGGTDTTLEITGQLKLSRANASAGLNLVVNGAGNTLLAGSLAVEAGSTNITISGSGNLTVAGPVTEGINTDKVLSKSGTGTLTLNGTYTSNSLTRVSDGILFINGDASAATGAFSVNTGTTTGTLGGIGTIGGATTISGVLAPGTSGIGTLTVTKDVTWNAGHAWKFDLGAGNTSDKLAITGTGSDFLKGTGGGWTFDFLNSTAQGTFTLATWTGTTDFEASDFSAINYDGGVPGVFSISDNSLIFTALPGSGYEAWAGAGVTFDADANGDGVSNGLAWLLGAANKDANALGLLPEVTETGGGLVLTFSCLNDANNGTATLAIEHSGDVGTVDDWVAVTVPDTTPLPEAQAPDVHFTISVNPGDSKFNVVTAIIQPGQAIDGCLFGRLKAVKP